MKRTKNPNEVEAESEEKLTEVNGDDEESPSQQPNRKHYCEVCNRQFSSGKAYGGHKRIHTTPFKNKGNKNKKEEEDVDLIRADVDGEFKCFLCEKEFQTKHSLFGHMRNHPERGWKGIRPPSPGKYDPSDSSDSSDDEDDDDDVAEDVYEAACILMMIHYTQSEYWTRKSMESANKDDDDKKDLSVDMKIKMEIKVNVTYPQDEANLN